MPYKPPQEMSTLDYLVCCTNDSPHRCSPTRYRGRVRAGHEFSRAQRLSRDVQRARPGGQPVRARDASVPSPGAPPSPLLSPSASSASALMLMAERGRSRRATVHRNSHCVTCRRGSLTRKRTRDRARSLCMAGVLSGSLLRRCIFKRHCRAAVGPRTT